MYSMTMLTCHFLVIDVEVDFGLLNVELRRRLQMGHDFLHF